ncbi:hypothetical protein PQQ51_12710 [Paraburkholderia xenovorans]|uniref:hypothetical protein n=1 Tax=Paraburkholderia xenovorans TaxID=36873 RepID=UPI0038B7B32A
MFARKSRMRDAASNLGYRASCRESARKGKVYRKRSRRKHSGKRGRINWRQNLTPELAGPRIDVPRKTEQRGDTDRTGNHEDSQHLAPRAVTTCYAEFK